MARTFKITTAFDADDVEELGQDTGVDLTIEQSADGLTVTIPDGVDPKKEHSIFSTLDEWGFDEVFT